MQKRFKALTEGLSTEDLQLLRDSAQDNLALANTLVENAVGYFHLPFALAPGFSINEKRYPRIPLVTEETSIVAGLCKNIALVRSRGTVSASQKGQGVIGQIHFPHLQGPQAFLSCIEKNKASLIQQANHAPCAYMAKRGGGVQELNVRLLPQNTGCTTAPSFLGIIHLLIDTKDAMGANIVTQTCDYLLPIIEALSGEKALMGIVSNHNLEALTQIELVLECIEDGLAQKIADASLIAQCDPYRAVTHNKGIMNGMDAVCLATGNDWRALEAGMHGFAAHAGTYRGLSQWRAEKTTKGTRLIGTLEGPINVGIVGGVTRIHPMAALALRCLDITPPTGEARELAYVTGAVGLIQNFAALRALVTGGISKGHMRLHLKNLLQQTDISDQERAAAHKALEERLETQKFVTLHDAWSILKELRS